MCLNVVEFSVGIKSIRQEKKRAVPLMVLHVLFISNSPLYLTIYPESGHLILTFVNKYIFNYFF